jgi:endogenous inhibitor of DNA gyrase (YacG/DUF329 family)
MRCPICKKPVEQPAVPSPGRSPRSAFPFFSERCKLIDLGRWLDGKYQVPVVEEDGDEGSYSESTEGTSDR